jgi:signal transduction histidine kinase
MGSAPKQVTAGSQMSERWIQAAFAAGLLVVGTLGAVCYVGIEQLLAQSAWAEHSRDVLDTMHRMLESVADVEAAERGFESTGDKVFISPFEAATRAAGEGMSALRKLTADNADQQRRIDQMEPQLSDLVRALSDRVAARRTRPAGASRLPTGREILTGLEEPLRSSARKFETAEQALLQQRESLARGRANLAKAGIVGGCLLAVLLLAVALVVSQRIQDEQEILRLNAELDRRVQERTAELRAANQELESFSYTVAHDLRAPLRAMEGFSQALVEDYGEHIDSEARAYLDQIVRGSGHLAQLIDGLLQLSRSVRGELSRDQVDLSALSLAILEEFARQEPARSVAWQVQSGLTVRADPRMIEIAMRNLLGNAWKYTSRSPAASIRVYASDEGPQRLFHVADNGSGFNMAHSEKLFQPFQRLHRHDEFPGIGIGLATVQRILNRHGGQIHAISAPGEGAEFTFTLPFAGDESAGASHENQDDAAGRGQSTGRTADLAGIAEGEPGQSRGGRA